VSKRYFSSSDVEALIPELTRILDELMPAHAEAISITARLQGEQRRLSLAGGGLIDRAAWHADTVQLGILTEKVRLGVEQIAELGGVTKDLGLGLVDFPHLIDDEEVNLCWRHGETEVRFWHGLDEGYAGRKPL
jgi:hypothetical protein